MGQVDIIYWKLAAICFVVGLAFFFFTTDSLIKGKLRLPAWVFSSFTFIAGFYFFHVAIASLAEFNQGKHDSIDTLLYGWHLIVKFVTWVA